MSNSYYIHSPNGQTSLVELCDRDGNVIAEILPKGSATHRKSVIDMLNVMCASLGGMAASSNMTTDQIRAWHAAKDWERRYK